MFKKACEVNETKDLILNNEKKIVNFGESYSIVEFFKSTEYYDIFTKVFKDKFDTLMSLVVYKIISSNSMQCADIWYDVNYICEIFCNANLTSQRISEFLVEIGKESVQRRVFSEYSKIFTNKKISTLVDSTGLPNHIDFPLKEWSNHNGNIEEETRLLYVIDRNTGMPTYFRYMAGNIVDVSTLNATIQEMKQYNVEIDYSIVDAGYYSEDNITKLYKEKISFLTRLPSNRKLYKKLIDKHGKSLETNGEIVVYGNRTLYIKEVEVELFEHRGYAYLVHDVKRYSEESNKYIIAAKSDDISDEQIRKDLSQKGKLILISSNQINTEEVIPLYYTRKKDENIFGTLKDDINILPLRVHKIETFRGYIMLSFLALIVELLILEKLNKKYTIDEFLGLTRNLMAKIFDDKIIVMEANKKQKDICEL